jgi:hypothetical protein
VTPASTAGLVLPLAAPILTGVAAIAALFRRTHAGVAPLVLLALVCDVAMAVAADRLARELNSVERTLFTWSPLGLYGVVLGVRRSADVALLSAPPLVLAWLGAVLATRRRRWFSALAEWSLPERASWAAALVAVTGALWAARAADFVSLFTGVAACAMGSTGLLAATAGAGPAGRRMVVGGTACAALLSAALVLGRVNGHFILAGLSTAGFGPGAFLGIAVAAAFAAGTAPFQGWLLRSARHPLAPALAAAGAVGAAALLLVVFRTIEPEGAWLAWLRASGWVAVFAGAGVALTRQ